MLVTPFQKCICSLNSFKTLRIINLRRHRTRIKFLSGPFCHKMSPYNKLKVKLVFRKWLV